MYFSTKNIVYDDCLWYVGRYTLSIAHTLQKA